MVCALRRETQDHIDDEIELTRTASAYSLRALFDVPRNLVNL